MTPRKLPDFTGYVNRNIFPDEFIYYQKTKKYIHCFCSACGESFTLDRSGSYEAEVTNCMEPEKVIHNEPGKCPKCRRKITFRAKGRSKKPQYLYAMFMYAEKHGDSILFRNIEVKKHYTNEDLSWIQTSETQRVLVTEGKRAHKWRRDTWKGGWTENDSDNVGNIYDGHIHPSCWRVAKTSFLKKYDMQSLFTNMEFQYSCCYGYYERSANSRKFLKIAIQLAHHPELEYVIKSGYGKIAEKVIYGAEKLRRGKKPWEIFGIRADRMKDLKKDQDNLELYRIEAQSGKRFSPEEVNYLQGVNEWYWQEIEKIMPYASLTKQAHYAAKQTEDGKYSSVSSFVLAWGDYLRMKSEAGYEMDSIAIFPKDLQAAHDRIVLELNAQKEKKRAEEVNQKFKGIPKRYKQDEKKYSWEYEGLTIRMAQNAGELVKESADLHHCVGISDQYMRKMDKGETYILFLRRRKQKAFITVEMRTKDFSICQWYGAHDTKPEQKFIDAWLKDYQKHLRQQAPISKTLEAV